MSGKEAYRCDRCGKEIARRPWRVRRFVEFDFVVRDKGLSDSQPIRNELCKDCNDSLSKFVKGEKLMRERIAEIKDEISKMHENNVEKQ